MNEVQAQRITSNQPSKIRGATRPIRFQAGFADLCFAIVLAVLSFPCFFIAFCEVSLGQAPLEQSAQSVQIDRQIDAWIGKLGSDSYAERTVAQRNLETYGVRALNAIRQATRSPDAQIASQARFLLQSNQLEWTWNNESFETRKIIEDYKLANTNEKYKFIEKLSELSNNHGIAALCRICCYETDEVNSKLAAMELLKRLEPPRIPGVESNPLFREKLDPTIVQALIRPSTQRAGMEDLWVDGSKNELGSEDLRGLVLKATEGANSRAARWVQLAYSSPNAFPVNLWTEILDDEQKLLENSSPDTRLSLVIDLTTWVAQESKRQPDGRKMAIQIAKRVPPLLVAGQPDPDRLISFAEWAFGVDLPELVQEQYLQLPKQFPQSVPPVLDYLLAESFAKQNQPQVADEIAKSALDRRPVLLSKDGSNIEIPTADATNPALPALPAIPQAPGNQQGPGNQQVPGSNPLRIRSNNFNYERASIAQILIKRGSFAWAEAELRESLAGQEDSPDSITMISLHTLALMLHEQDRDADAAKVLEKWMARYESEKLFRMQVDDFQLDLPSNYYLYLANHHAKEGRVEQAREDYFKSISLANDNVDALIGLAKLEENPEQKRRRIAEQEQAISTLRNEVEAIDRDLRLANPMFQPMEKKRLANSLNTLAWLMTNTDSDPREALMLSRRSCSLSPDQSAYQDTLAHCLERNGKYQEAFKTQIKALKLEPHQLSLQRALVRFYEKAAQEIAGKPGE